MILQGFDGKKMIWNCGGMWSGLVEVKMEVGERCVAGGVDFLSSKLEMNQQIIYNTEVISIYNFFLNSTFHFDVLKHDLKCLAGPCMT